MRDKVRVQMTDKVWEGVVEDILSDHIFTRVSAKGLRFSNIDFRYSIFDSCYLRECSFDSCNFIGCRFLGTNFHRSSFIGCKFDYAVFERTQIDDDILDNCCPDHENLKARFARALRVNYQTLGATESVNKAIVIELNATEEHLYKAWHSNARYYRAKYKRLKRFRAFASWIWFRWFDFLWGNGEKPMKLISSALIVMVLIAFADAFFYRDRAAVRSYWAAFADAPAIFLGVKASLSQGALTLITFARLLLLALFISVLTRRFARR